MIHRSPAVLAGLLAVLLAGCSRPDASPAKASGEATRAFLEQVGRVRTRINADNRDRIPGLIRSLDQAELTAEGARMDEDARTLAAYPAAGIDADALTFTRNFIGILQAYRAVCVDTAEMFRALREEAARQTDPDRHPPELKFDPASYQRDTIGTLNSLLDLLTRVSPSDKSRLLFLAPSIEKVRRDRDLLRSAKQAHHDFTAVVKAAFATRYPGIDWTSKDLLP